MRWTNPSWLLLFLALLSTAVQSQEEQVPLGEDVPLREVQGIPNEPQVQGGFAPTVPETQIEPISSEIPDSPPFDGYSDDEDSHFLVDDALHILSALSRTHSSSESTSSSIFLRFLHRALDILKSVSFLQYSSQEEPLTAHSEKHDTLEQAMSLLTKAAEMHNSDALYLLGELNFYGNYSKADYRESFKWFKKLAEKDGNSTAQQLIGFMYATGIGNAVDTDQGAALMYHTFAALGGNTRSEMTVAYRHLMGIGTPRSCEDAVHYYKSVADKSIAYYRSGPPGGRHLPRNTHRLADDEGGVYGSGASYTSSGANAKRNTITTESSQSIDDVLEYLRYMAEKGDIGAQFSLARVYYDGSRTIPRNFPRALFYFGSVARQHWTKDGKVVGKEVQGKGLFGAAASYLGLMHMRGEGVPQSFDKAKIWFTRGVDLGDPIAQYGMGILYILGSGDVPKDQGKALQHFKASAEQNHPPAQVALAKMYLEQNEVIIATRYFELAARQGHVEAFYFLAELNHKGIGREKSCGIAAAYYKMVAEKVEASHSTLGEANAAWKDGRFTDAMIGFMMAAEQGYESGQANVAYLIDQTQSKGRQVLLKFLNKPRSHEADNMALIYWTRSARQANIDSLVKMGDWYLNGYGLPSPDPVKAAACYQAAVESMSAMGMWNLGWCHENGIGVEQDFHLAKRYYDMAAHSNVEAALPVALSLVKLRIRSFYNKITHGKINSIGQDDLAIKREMQPKWTFTQAFKDILRKWSEEDLPAHPTPPAEEDYGSADGYIPTDDFEDIDFDEDYVESLVILGLCGAVAFLLWWRNMRNMRYQRDQRIANAVNNPNQDGAPPVEEENRGLFPDPNDPDNPEFARWIGGAPII